MTGPVDPAVFLQFLDLSGQALLRVDSAGRIAQLNAALAARLTPADPAAWIGLPVADLLDGPPIVPPPDAAPAPAEILVRARADRIRFAGLLARCGGDLLFLGREAIATASHALEEISRANMALANLSRELAERNAELIEARDKIKVLSGLIPICAGCKKIRDDDGFWGHVERYIMQHADVRFSHGICPDCAMRLYGIDLGANKRAREDGACGADGCAATPPAGKE